MGLNNTTALLELWDKDGYLSQVVGMNRHFAVYTRTGGTQLVCIVRGKLRRFKIVVTRFAPIGLSEKHIKWYSRVIIFK
jgi:hypothetical protein